MRELGPDNVLDYLRETGRLPADRSATAQALAWGVSNVVLRIEPEGDSPLVIKQSRAKLRTQADWFSRLDRIWREADFMRSAAPLLPKGAVPRVLFEDRENYLFAMEAVAADHAVWKQTLLAGQADPMIADRLGEYLSSLHRGSAGRVELQRQFADPEVFIELRVDPFYRRVAEVHSEIRPAMESLIDEMFATRVCLVHADFSPKNILVTPDRIVLVDFETGHWGDPAFDLGFFLSHLLLKTVLHRHRAREYLQLAQTFWTSYSAGITALVGKPPWQLADLERRTIGHLAGCMLARIDGKSLVDYLPEPSQQELVRNYTLELLLDPPAGLRSAFEQLQAAL